MTLNDTADPLDDAVLAARLFALAPATFKGMVLRGNGRGGDAQADAGTY
jgi:magnesium chelatase subunit D